MSISRFRRLVSASFIALLMTACGGDKSEVSSGGGDGGLASDGGAQSAKFAGTYQGEITTELKGDRIDDQSSTDPVTIVIRSDGTASITIDGQTVEGTVSGNQFAFSIRIIEERDLLECEGNAVISGILNGSSLTGSVNGSGGCSLLGASSGISISGSLRADKT